jgi:hypothetical protein
MSIIQDYRKDGKISREALVNSTEPELLELLEVVNKDVTTIKNQLGEAKVDFINRGQYADAGWYQRAEAAKKIKG